MAKTKTITLSAATEQTVTRRRVLLGLGAATASAAVVVTPTSAKSATVARAENPELLKAYKTLQDARTEEAKAKDALEWLVDEWRHLWPLAPEALLGGANADRYGRDDNNAERDIAGRYLKRDTSTLTKRLPKKRREEQRTTCFSVLSPGEANQAIEFWTRQLPKGRTQKALENNRARRDTFIKEYQQKLPLARAYEQETARLREASGVEAVLKRIREADANAIEATTNISLLPAYTHEGLQIKAEALADNPLFKIDMGGQGVLADMARFVQAVRDMGEQA